jgi:hypothetical protein
MAMPLKADTGSSAKTPAGALRAAASDAITIRLPAPRTEGGKSLNQDFVCGDQPASTRTEIFLIRSGLICSGRRSASTATPQATERLPIGGTSW